jgi:hypothetical protein
MGLRKNEAPVLKFQRMWGTRLSLHLLPAMIGPLISKNLRNFFPVSTDYVYGSALWA